MPTTPNRSVVEPPPSKPANAKPPEIGAASVPETLAQPHVNADIGLTHAEVDPRRKDFKLYFWRTSHGAEVDLLVEHQGKIALAIECKHKATVDRSDLSGLASLREAFPDVDCHIVAPVKHAQKVEFAKAVGPDEMLKVMAGV